MMKFLKMLATELFVSESVKKTIIMHELQEANKKSNKKK
jgi:hypothetical protein|tara:strand:- start:978 stop:1094 length:117 start_codon:yes stop_codon:yes gene_type:complete